MSSPFLSLFCVSVLVMMLMQGQYRAEAEISFDQVKKDLAPCAAYFTMGWLLSDCCPAVRGVVGKADTQANRQNICRCFVSRFSASNIAKAQKLSETCKVPISFAFSSDNKIDCSMVK